jgi:hypothetical protein
MLCLDFYYSKHKNNENERKKLSSVVLLGRIDDTMDIDIV